MSLFADDKCHSKLFYYKRMGQAKAALAKQELLRLYEIKHCGNPENYRLKILPIPSIHAEPAVLVAGTAD
jgi:hypothetical protein